MTGHRFTRAIVRRPAPTLAEGMTTSGLGSPDHELALEQHARYVHALEEAGLHVTVLEPLNEFPDGHFLEDVAVITPELAVIARPGAKARRGEEQAIEPALRRHRATMKIEPPGTLEGGDVLIMGRRVFVGLSSRTNDEGAFQLGEILACHGYRVETVGAGRGIHLKSSVCSIDDTTLLVTRGMELGDFARIVVDEGDEYAANSLRVNDRILMPLGFPRVRARLQLPGVSIVELDMSEMRKMDGGLTCLSLRF